MNSELTAGVLSVGMPSPRSRPRPSSARRPAPYEACAPWRRIGQPVAFTMARELDRTLCDRYSPEPMHTPQLPVRCPELREALCVAAYDTRDATCERDQTGSCSVNGG